MVAWPGPLVGLDLFFSQQCHEFLAAEVAGAPGGAASGGSLVLPGLGEAQVLLMTQPAAASPGVTVASMRTTRTMWARIWVTPSCLG